MKGRRAATGARDLALEALVRVERDDAFASAALGSAIASVPRLDARDRALATELAYGVLRWRGALDAALSSCAPRGIEALDAHVLAALRIAVYQIAHLDRIPPAAAVSSAVDQVRARRGPRLAGFANGLLRAVARSAAALERAKDPVSAHPRWLVDALAGILPPAELHAALLASTRPAPVCLRLNQRRTSAPALTRRLQSDQPGVRIEPGQLAPTCLRVEAMGDPQATEAFRAGEYTVQDEGAQVVVADAVRALRQTERSGPRVLDACAGRGGKTGALAEALGPEARIDAVDRNPDKLARLEADLARLGLGGGVRPLAVDLEVGTGPLAPGYDLILVDAPCSGVGIIRRRPEIRWRRSRDDVLRLATIQRALLARVAPLLAPSGVLVYCVCSVLPEEGQAVVEPAPCGLALTDLRQLWPHRDDTDGFTIARFAKTA